MKVFLSGSPPGRAPEILATLAEVVRGPRIPSNELAASAAEVEAIVSVLTDRIDRALLASTPRLRVVANIAVGYDNIDTKACAERGVLVTNTPDVLTDATADFTFGLILAAARRIVEGDRIVRAGGFAGFSPTMLLGLPVHKKTLGVLGFGRIGRAVARRARGFDMHVLYTNTKDAPSEVPEAAFAEHVSLDDLFLRADIVTLHCPFNDDTRHIASRKRIFSMKEGAIFVNTARGGCVDEPALAEALLTGPLAAAGLDVFDGEPRVSEALSSLRNVVLTPHAASADVETRSRMAELAAENVVAVLRGKPPLTPIK